MCPIRSPRSEISIFFHKKTTTFIALISAIFLTILLFHDHRSLQRIMTRSVNPLAFMEKEQLDYTGNSAPENRPRNQRTDELLRNSAKKSEPCDPAMTIVTVACGDRLEEAINLVKSILMFSRCNMTIVVFVEPKDVQKTEKNFNVVINAKLFRSLYVQLLVEETVYPEGLFDADLWKTMYSACSTFRLFFPNILQETDAVIYLDSDTLVVSPIEELWNKFSSMKNDQIAGLVPEHEDAAVGWYNRRSHVPHVGLLGVNSGVMLMNLTRMRQWDWNNLVQSTYKLYKPNLQLPDQDILNIIFHNRSNSLFILPCKWNFRTLAHHCNLVTGYCPSAFEEGVAKILHGNSNSFHSGEFEEEYFYYWYKFFEKFDPFNQDVDSGFLQPLEKTIRNRASQPICLPLDLPLVSKLRQLVPQTVT